MASDEDLPSDNSANLPALRPQGTELSVVRPGSKLVSRIAGDAFRHLPSQTERLWRVGDYEVNEQSYRQIMIWLDHMKAAGEPINLEGFARAQLWNSEIIANFLVERIRDKEGIDVRLDKIAMIRIREACSKAQIELSRTTSAEIKLPFITAKADSGNMKAVHFQEIVRHDDFNKIVKFNNNNNINVSPWIINNSIHSVRLFSTKIVDLSGCQNLNKLVCYGNSLRNIYLPEMPYLRELYCNGNDLTYLDISNVPNLRRLDCSKNKLENLDVSNSPMLIKLRCDSQMAQNPLNNIDIRGCVTKEFEFFMVGQFSIDKRPDQFVKDCLWTL